MHLNLILIITLLSISLKAHCELRKFDGAKIESIFVNGAADAANSGVTCFKTDIVPVDVCTNGYIGVPNNNNELISALLTAKTTGGEVWIYYTNNDTPAQHCPGIVNTPCSLISVGLK
ncbi:hypothetical protein [Alteromonas sp. ASW11-130]|uniref:hypothetical protein n=1 Tax=Alteromonas sp. ASW11-130 TaxID=3015775 RepID=UPI00224286DE|nr:hypothetical protein [Alteromonas sp. ASW11-130]MCW8091867.1 hypothetical protein [Alteromonas sp. ASW11-130]